MKKKRSLTTFILPSRCLLFSPSNNPSTTALTMQCSSIKCSFTLCLLPLQSLSSPTSAVTQHQLAQPVLESSLTICGRWQEARQLRGRRGEVHPACNPLRTPHLPIPLHSSTSLTLALPCDAYRPGQRGPLTHETGRGGEGYFKSRASGKSLSKSLVLPSKAFSWRYKLAHFIFDYNDEAEKVKTSISSSH